MTDSNAWLRLDQHMFVARGSLYRITLEVQMTTHNDTRDDNAVIQIEDTHQPTAAEEATTKTAEGPATLAAETGQAQRMARATGQISHLQAEWIAERRRCEEIRRQAEDLAKKFEKDPYEELCRMPDSEESSPAQGCTSDEEVLEGRRRRLDNISDNNAARSLAC